MPIDGRPSENKESIFSRDENIFALSSESCMTRSPRFAHVATYFSKLERIEPPASTCSVWTNSNVESNDVISLENTLNRSDSDAIESNKFRFSSNISSASRVSGGRLFKDEERRRKIFEIPFNIASFSGMVPHKIERRIFLKSPTFEWAWRAVHFTNFHWAFIVYLDKYRGLVMSYHGILCDVTLISCALTIFTNTMRLFTDFPDALTCH